MLKYAAGHVNIMRTGFRKPLNYKKLKRSIVDLYDLQ